MKSTRFFSLVAITLLFALAAPMQVTAQANALGLTYNVLYTFTGESDGAQPDAALIVDDHGTFYGTTQYGGDLMACVDGPVSGCGTVFKIDAAGNYSVLYTFTGGTDGANPNADLIRDAEGNLYGTTFGGGSGFGVVFRIDAMGNETPLHIFNGADGRGPLAGLILDEAGDLYGDTAFGGNLSNCNGRGCGVVFKINHITGQESMLYEFTGGADGRFPESDLLRDPAGNLYGTTYIGGAFNAGVVYKVDPNGVETPLYTFTAGTDGARASSGLVQDEQGNFYGTAEYGGDLNACQNGSEIGCGVVYKLAPDGTQSVLYSFTGMGDGASPFAGVVRDNNNNLYGTTISGGNFNGALCTGFGCGVVFKVQPNGHETVLYTFAGQADGGIPFGGLLRESSGNIFGMTTYGGDFNSPQGWCFDVGCGVVFRIGACFTALCQQE